MFSELAFWQAGHKLHSAMAVLEWCMRGRGEPAGRA
ncbi:hypothetical protein P3T35_003445 [Kitasatospora sp. GP30]|nr:hypothetical protein [Kitasatospora sp. GP30]